MSESNKLSFEEQADRSHLEQTVLDSIQSAQRELLQIEQTGLWRSSHKTFEEYCFARFGFDPFNVDAEVLIELAYRASFDAASLMRSEEDEP